MATTAAPTKTKWTLDPTHSEIQFKVRHLMISNTTGWFDNYEVNVETNGDDFQHADISFSADAASINTNNEQRDGHLKSADFLDVAQYPKVTFKATKLEKVDNDSYELYGDFSLHGVTKSVKLDVEFGGTAKDPWGNYRAGFSINGKINRKDFGLSWNAALETGGVVLGEEVRIHCTVELIKQLEKDPL